MVATLGLVYFSNPFNLTLIEYEFAKHSTDLLPDLHPFLQCLLHFISDKQSFADNFKTFIQTVLASKASFLFTTTDQIKAITDYFKTRYVSQCHIRPLITFLLNTYDYAQVQCLIVEYG